MDNEKSFFGYVKAINQADRTLDVVASTSDIDRDGEIILPSAFVETIGSFRANPVILAAHLHRLQDGGPSVIGAAIPDTIVISDKDLSFKMKFATTKLAEEYWLLYRDKFMKSFSVGFIGLKGENREIKGKSVYVHTAIELLEVSAVPVPSNRAALARAKRLGWLEAKKEEREEEKVLAETRKEYEAQGKDFDQEADEFAEALLGIGKYADPRAYKDFAHPPQGAMDEDGDDEFSDDALPDCSTLVRGR
jgi:HK97 family phage prohead protease